MLRTLVNMNPVAELRQVAEMMDRAFGEVRESLNEDQTSGWTLPVDIYERDNKLFVKAAVAGVKPEDLDLTVQDNILTINGEVRHSFEQNDVVYRREYRYGAFTRSIRLPENVDPNGIDAEFDHGFVTITIPRVEPPKPKSLKINVKRAENQKSIGAQSGDANGVKPGEGAGSVKKVEPEATSKS